MALFEEFGKKISGAGQGMAKQTKDFMEVSRLNAVISDQEKQIQQLFTSIGEAYFKRHYQDPNAEEKASIEQIKFLYNEISRSRKNIDLIRGIIKCPRCGADVAVGSAFCSRCGGRMPQPIPQPAPQQAPQPTPQPVPQPAPQPTPVISQAVLFQPQAAPQPAARPTQGLQPVPPVQVQPDQAPPQMMPVPPAQTEQPQPAPAYDEIIEEPADPAPPEPIPEAGADTSEEE